MKCSVRQAASLTIHKIREAGFALSKDDLQNPALSGCLCLETK